MRHQEPLTAPFGRHRSVQWLVWGLAASHATLAAAWVAPFNFFVLDLAASLSVLWGWLGVALAGGLWALRSRRAAVVALAASAVAFGALWRTPRLSAARHEGAASRNVSLLVFNGSSSRLGRPEEALAMLHTHDPDVIVLIEPSRTLLELIRDDSRLTSSHPHRRLPEGAGSGWRVVLTRWPQRGGDGFAGGADEAARGGMHVMVVDRPEGAFGLVQVNPESPRTPERWRAGNARLEEAIVAVRERLRPLGVPIIVGGDLNASPTGWRSARLAREGGLARAKPRFVMDGTFPAGLPALLRLPIDDVFASEGVGVVEWRALGSCGSDHRALLVRLRLPG